MPLWLLAFSSFWFLALSSRYNLASTNFPATAALPASTRARGALRRVAPAAEVTTRFPPTMAAVAAPAAGIAGTAGRKKGFAEAETRLTARVKAIKP